MTVAGPLFVREEDERGVRYRRPTSDPRGATGPVLASESVRPSPFDLIGSPDPFPLEWVERAPDWLGNGEGVRVVLNGPEVGRAAGYIRLHGSCFEDGTGACRQPPPVPYEAFHRGEAEVIDEHGQVKEISVGAIAIVGGHSSRGGAKTSTAAIEFIDQPEKAKLRGVLLEDERGLLFLGCGRPDLTRAEAVMINQSDTSGEWWPLFERGANGQVGLVGNGSGYDMIGVALVTGGAYRKSIPERFRVMAAALGRELDEREVEILMAEPHDHEVTVEIHDDCGCRGSCSKCFKLEEPPGRITEQPLMFATIPARSPKYFLDTSEDESDGPPDAEAEPLLAAVPAEELNEVRSALDDAVRRINELEIQLAAVQREMTQVKASDLTEEEITLPDRLDETEAVVRAMEERMRKIEGDNASQAGQSPMNTADGPRPASESQLNREAVSV